MSRLRPSVRAANTAGMSTWSTVKHVAGRDDAHLRHFGVVEEVVERFDRVAPDLDDRATRGDRRERRAGDAALGEQLATSHDGRVTGILAQTLHGTTSPLARSAVG
jgi:hypothetical protein